MGYMGFGTQRWISTLKPRKFLGKRSKPDGGGVDAEHRRDLSTYYHLEKNDLKNLGRIKYTPKFRRKLRSQIRNEKKKQTLYMVLAFSIATTMLVLLFSYLNDKFTWF